MPGAPTPMPRTCRPSNLGLASKVSISVVSWLKLSSPGAVTSDVHFVKDVAAQVRDGTVDFGATHVHAQDDVTVGVEFQQGAPAASAPLGAAVQAHEAFRDQPVHDAHDGGQADVKAFGDGGAGDGAFAADDLQDCGAVDIAHGSGSDGEAVSHGFDRVVHSPSYLHDVILTYSL